MIKVLIFAQHLNGGGAERVLVNYLSQLDYTRFQVTLVLAQKLGVFIDLVPKQVKVVSLNKRKTMFCLPSLRQLIIKLNPDVVYSTLIRTSIILSLAITGLSNKPKLILRSPNSPKLLSENKQSNALQEFLLKRAYQAADLVIAQTKEMAIELEHYYALEKNKVQVVLNPVNKKLIDSLLLNQASPFDSNYINVVAAGRLTKQKGFDILISSFADVVNLNPKFRLHIIGEDVDNQLSSLITLAKCLKIESFVTFHGFQLNPYTYFKFCDLYVLSSRWEGLPNTVLENLYLQKPIVATRCISFMEDIINNGQNGWLVDVDNEEMITRAILNFSMLSATKESATEKDFDINSLFQEV